MRQKLFGTLFRCREMRGWLFGCCLLGLVACGGAGPGHSQSRTQTPDVVEKREPVSARPKVIKTEKESKREEPPVEERREFEREHYEDPGFLRVEEVRPVECFRTVNQSEARLEGTEEFLLVVPWRASEKLNLALVSSEGDRLSPGMYAYGYATLDESSPLFLALRGAFPQFIQEMEKGTVIHLQFEVRLSKTAEQIEVRLSFPVSVYSESEQKEVEQKQYLRILVEPERCREWMQ